MLEWHIARAREAEIRREAETARRESFVVAHRPSKGARRL